MCVTLHGGGRVKMGVGLQDVARLAGVSKTLVSRVINNQSGVSDKSRKKILAAMDELHYEPNALARSLVLRSTDTIGVVMDTLCERYFFNMIDGLETGAERIGYNVIFSSGRNQISCKERAVKYFMQGRTDGVIFYGSRVEDEPLIHNLSKGNFPFVVIENTFPALDINNVVVDNAFGSAIAVDHLFRCGCRKIYHVTGDIQHRASLDRRDGYITAMQRHGITVNDRMIIQANFDFKETYRMMKALLPELLRGEFPDAFYCGSDNTAYGLMLALEEAGVRVPEDVMIIGFDDDTPPPNHHFRPLTTLAQPLYQMGMSAMEILLESIQTPEGKKNRVVFYPELVIRETTR